MKPKGCDPLRASLLGVAQLELLIGHEARLDPIRAPSIRTASERGMRRGRRLSMSIGSMPEGVVRIVTFEIPPLIVPS